MIYVSNVMDTANHLYFKMREAEGRPQSGYGIESSQIKALAEALVDAVNTELEKYALDQSHQDY